MRKRYLNQKELGKLFLAIKKEKNARDLLAFKLVLLLGLRVGELTKLCIEDIDFTARSIAITGLKGGRTREYNDMDENLFSLLKRYLRKNKFHKGKIFPVSRHCFQMRFKCYCKTAGIGDYSIHSLRHSCAILMVENGSSAIEVMLHLRHRNIQSSQIYFEQLNCERNFAKTQETVLGLIG